MGMRKFALLTICFCLVLSSMLIGEDGSILRDSKEPHYEWARDGSEMDVDVSGSLGGYAIEFSTALFGFSGSEPSGNPRSTDCVEVDIELPDTVGPGPGAGWGPPLAEGHFELLNCGDAPAEIHLTLALTIIVDHVADTTVISPDFTVYLGAGESISHDFLIPVPPFDGVYTACVSAVAGEAEMTDCATMVVNGIEFPGVPFSAPGILVQGTNCVLFAPHGNPEITFELEHYGSFQVGDEVFVSGMLFWDCDTDCVDADGCVLDNTIGDFEVPDIPFEACGVLIQGVECILLETLEPYPYGMFVVENLGQYSVSDTVFVAGTLLQDCPSICMEGTGCIVENVIEPCPGDPGDGIPVQGCGVLVADSGCVLFAPTVGILGMPDGGVLLENYGGFGVWDTVFVDGVFQPGFQPGCPSAPGIIEENTIGVCDGAFSGHPNRLEIQNYPNPFNPSTTIALTLPYETVVKVTIYNIVGQVVTTLVDDVLSVGTHEFVWNSSNAGVASGMYFYRAQAGDIDVTRKMLLVK